MLRMQIKIKASVERVFHALTTAEALQTWFTEFAHVDLENDEYNFWGRFTPQNPSPAQGQHAILEYEVNRRIKFQWQIGETATSVTFKLLPRDENLMVLTLHHSNVDDGSHQIGAYTLEDFWFLSLENLRRYLDGKPADARVDFSDTMQGNIRHVTTIDAAPQRVFDVLLKPEKLNRWIASHATVDEQVGGEVDLGWQGVKPLKILELKPAEKLAYTWLDEGDETVVTWTLEESGGKTRLTFVHSGFADDFDNAGIHAGWRNFVNWVRSVAEYGDGWQPPLIPLREEMKTYYAASIHHAQAELIFDL